MPLLKNALLLILILSFRSEASLFMDMPDLSASSRGTTAVLLFDRSAPETLLLFPSSLARSGSRSVSAGFTSWMDIAGVGSVSAAQKTRLGHVGISFQYASYGKIRNLGLNGEEIGILENYDWMLGIGYGSTSGSLLWGVHFRTVGMQLGEDLDGTWACAGGSLEWTVFEKRENGVLKICGALQNVNLIPARVKTELSYYPVQIIPAIMYGFPPLGSHQFRIGLSGSFSSREKSPISLGSEYVWREWITFRAGIPLSREGSNLFSIGLGIRKESVHADYGFEMQKSGLAHFISIGFHAD